MAVEMEQARQEKLALLALGMERVAARLLWATRGGKPEDWLLLGRAVGRVEKDLRLILAAAPDGEELELLASLYLHEPVLEAQVRCAYLFARAHSLGRPGERQMHSTLAALKTAGG